MFNTIINCYGSSAVVRRTRSWMFQTNINQKKKKKSRDYIDFVRKRWRFIRNRSYLYKYDSTPSKAFISQLLRTKRLFLRITVRALRVCLKTYR